MLMSAAADEVRRHGAEIFVDRLLLLGRDIGLAPAVEAGLGLDAHEEKVPGASGIEEEALDVGDLHGVRVLLERSVHHGRIPAEGGMRTGGGED